MVGMARYWWVLVLRGVVAILFGVMAYLWPGLTAVSLVFLFGIYALVDGVAALIGAFRTRSGNQPWWALLLEGIIGIGAGIVAFVWPGITALSLLYVIATWAVLTGIFEIVAAVQLRREINNEWLLVLTGIASIIFGALLFVWPGAGILTLIWLVAGYAILFGILLIALGFRLRTHKDEAVANRYLPPNQQPV